MAQRLLIASATFDYPNLPASDNRQQLMEVLDSVVDLFTNTLHYKRELEAISNNPPKQIFGEKLEEWFASPDRDPADWVVFYYTGHAEVPTENSLYLITTDFRPPLYSTAFSLDQLAIYVRAPRAPGVPRRTKNLLVIIDSCFAGEGVADLADRLTQSFQKSSGSQFYMLGAALPNQEAKAGALAKALVAAVQTLSKRYVGQQWLFLEQLGPEINKQLRVHDAVWVIAASTREEPQFFPNPSFVDTGGQPVVASEARRAIVDQEFRDHWSPRARAVEFDYQPGDFFSGREDVLKEIQQFLVSPSLHKTHIVTGRPGAGKSAILSRLITTSSEGGMPGFDLALHAKRKTFEDVRARLAARLHVEPDTDSILSALKTAKSPVRIAIDALDEAAQPELMVDQLLRPMSEIDSVKLVVGTRKNQVRGLGDSVVIDIDRDAAGDKDIAQYVKRRLLAPGDSAAPPNPYLGKEDLASEIGQKIAEKASRNFLVARLAAESLLAGRKALSAAALKRSEFPETVGAAFDEYLSRYGAKEQKVRDLLQALAYAEGQGLPWDNIWAPVASALSNGAYTDRDIEWLLEEAGAFILETSEHGRSVYRLFHQALIDTLRKGRRTRRIQSEFLDALVESAPKTSSGAAGRDWLMASRYVRSYLALHAVKCGRLAEVTADPLFLLAADPATLLRAMDDPESGIDRSLSAVYKAAVHQIRANGNAATPVGASASYLELAARQWGLMDMVDRIAQLPLRRSWSTQWAQWTTSVRQSFGQNRGVVTALAAANVDSGERCLVAVGRIQGGVEVWDVDKGELIVEWTPSQAGPVRHVALTDSPEGLIVAASWPSGHCGVYRQQNQQEVIVLPTNENRAPPICLAERNGEMVLVIAHPERSISIRRLADLSTILEAKDATRSSFTGIGVIHRANRLALVTIGDSKPHESYEELESTIMVRSLDDLSLEWQGRGEESAWLLRLEAATCWDRELVILSPSYGELEVWDLNSGKLVYKAPETQASKYAWLYESNQNHWFLFASSGGLLARPLQEQTVKGSLTIEAASADRRMAAQGEVFSGISKLHGRAVLFGAAGDSVNAWDLEDFLSRSKASPEVAQVLSLACGGKSEICAGGIGAVQVYDPLNGTQLGSHAIPDQVVASLAVSKDNSIVALTWNGSIHIIAPNRKKSRVIEAGEAGRAVRIAEWQGRELIFATIKRSGGWFVLIWDLKSRKEVTTSFNYGLRYGEENKPMGSLAVHETADGVRFAFASKYGKVMVANFTGPIESSTSFSPRQFEEWTIPEAGVAYTNSLAIGSNGLELWLAAGCEDGNLAVWDFLTGKRNASPLRAHSGSIDHLCFARMNDRLFLISGGGDGYVRLWTPDLEKLFEIDMDEPVTALAWAGDRKLAVGGRSGLVLLNILDWDSR